MNARLNYSIAQKSFLLALPKQINLYCQHNLDLYHYSDLIVQLANEILFINQIPANRPIIIFITDPNNKHRIRNMYV